MKFKIKYYIAMCLKIFEISLGTSYLLINNKQAKAVNKETYRMRSIRGITLIELLVVIMIIGVLAAIAIPTYNNYMVRARRAEAKTALEQVRAAQEMWRAERGSYGSLAQIQNTMKAPPLSISSYYNWEFTVLNANSFTARAVPIGSQPATEELFINHHGQKWPAEKWAK